MAYELEGLVLYTGKLFEPGHLVHNWADDIKREFVRAASREAPENKRTNKGKAALPRGSLRLLIDGETSRVGTHELDIKITSGAPYSIYVIRGTGRIYSKSGRFPAGTSLGGRFRPIGPGQGMYLPANPGYGKSKFVQSVSGQTANNFLQRAADVVAVSHPSLRGMIVG